MSKADHTATTKDGHTISGPDAEQVLHYNNGTDGWEESNGKLTFEDGTLLAHFRPMSTGQGSYRIPVDLCYVVKPD